MDKEKQFSIRRSVLNLSIQQWGIADSLDLTKLTPNAWLKAMEGTGDKGGFLTALLTREEREFVDLVYETPASKKKAMNLPKVIAVDFDGTCVTHEFPKVGHDIGAAPVLKKFADAGTKIILWTIRSNGQTHPFVLADAVAWFEKNGIPLFGINENPEQRTWSSSPKAYAEVFFDDAAFGAPLIHPPDGSRPYFDWTVVDRVYFGSPQG